MKLDPFLPALFLCSAARPTALLRRETAADVECDSQQIQAKSSFPAALCCFTMWKRRPPSRSRYRAYDIEPTELRILTLFLVK